MRVITRGLSTQSHNNVCQWFVRREKRAPRPLLFFAFRFLHSFFVFLYFFFPFFFLSFDRVTDSKSINNDGVTEGQREKEKRKRNKPLRCYGRVSVLLSPIFLISSVSGFFLTETARLNLSHQGHNGSHEDSSSSSQLVALPTDVTFLRHISFCREIFYRQNIILVMQEILFHDKNKNRTFLHDF